MNPSTSTRKQNRSQSALDADGKYQKVRKQHVSADFHSTKMRAAGVLLEIRSVRANQVRTSYKHFRKTRHWLCHRLRAPNILM